MVLSIVENIGNVGVTGNGVTWWQVAVRAWGPGSPSDPKDSVSVQVL